MKIIIIYATRYGSTAEVAKRIQNELESECTLINIMAEKVPQLDGYDTVILGGSIYIGRVQKQLTAYMQKHQKELLLKNVGLYLCAGAPKQEDRNKELQTAFTPELLNHAVAKDVLGYAFSFERMHNFNRIIMKKIKGDAINAAEYYDEQIKQFAKAIAAK